MDLSYKHRRAAFRHLTGGLVLTVVFAAVGEAQGAAGRAVPSPASAVDSQLRKLVADQALGEIVAGGAVPKLLSSLKLAASGVALESVPSPDPAVRLWRARLTAFDAWHPYYVGEDGTNIFPLAGFSSPDVVRFVNAAGGLRDASSIDTLVRLLDPYGGVRVLRTATSAGHSSTDRALLAKWERARKSIHWQGDTTLVLDDGRRVVRVTSLTRSAGSFPQWYPVMQAFVSDVSGRLLSWHREVGPSLGP